MLEPNCFPLKCIPLFFFLEGYLYWLVHHVHHKAILVALGNFIQVVPHWNISGKLGIIMKKQPIEPRIILQWPKEKVNKSRLQNDLWTFIELTKASEMQTEHLNSLVPRPLPEFISQPYGIKSGSGPGIKANIYMWLEAGLTAKGNHFSGCHLMTQSGCYLMCPYEELQRSSITSETRVFCATSSSGTA